MLSTEERNGTKFIWKIENLSFMKEEKLFSPTFSSHSITWCLKISTSSLNDTKVINIFLYQKTNLRQSLNCSLAFLNSYGFPLVWKEKKNFNIHMPSKPYLFVCNFDNFIEKSEMFGSRKNTFLPNNTLTVQCLIWQTPEELELPLKCFARTRIEPIASVNKTFIWRIENVSGFTEPQTRVEEIGRNFAFLKIQLFFGTDDILKVSFKPSLLRVHLKMKVSMLNTMGENIQVLNMKTQDYKDLPTNITKTLLRFHKNLFLNQDTLSLQFTCTLSTQFTFHDMVNENEILINNPQPTIAPGPASEPSQCTDQPESKQPDNPVSKKLSGADSISQALQEMYEGFLSDCILKIGTREYNVHRAILGARSRFFKAMFTADMKEKDADFVDIKDVDEDTLQRLLRFIYLDIVEEQMGWENALKLYAAADMYAIESLQRNCSAILRSGLCVHSVLQVLKVADMHQDQELKSAAMDFISCNDSEIVGSQCWLRFEEESVALAVEALRKLYLQKVND